MRKLLLILTPLVLLNVLLFVNRSHADGPVQYNWSTPTGGSWQTPSCSPNNGVLQLSGTGCAVVASTNVTLPGNVIHTVQSVVQLSSFSTITPTSDYITLCTTGTGNINMAGSGTANLPVISTASATNGQQIILTSTGTSCSVTVSSGVSAGLDLGSATRLIAPGKILTLIYNSTLLEWVEQAFGNN